MRRFIRNLRARFANPTFDTRRTFSRAIELTDRRTGDVYTLYQWHNEISCCVNHCYQTTRPTISAALHWAHDEARMHLRAAIACGLA